MKLNKVEYSALVSLLKKTPNQAFNAFDRTEIVKLDPDGGHAQLQAVKKVVLQKLVGLLPSGAGKVLHPILASVKSKAKEALRLLRPAYFGGGWPRVYRFLSKLNNARAGLRDGGAGQIARLHPKAMAISLKGEIVWDESNGGDLVLMGRQADLTKLIGDAGDGLKLVTRFKTLNKDVNSELDDMYGPLPGDDPTWAQRKDELPLYVSYEAGDIWNPTDDEGEVVLNAPRAIIEVAVGRTAGVAGAAAPLPDGAAGIGLASASAVKDLAGMIGPHAVEKIQNARELRRQLNVDKTIYTITIGVGPIGKNHVCTKSNSLDQDSLLSHVKDLLPKA